MLLPSVHVPPGTFDTVPCTSYITYIRFYFLIGGPKEQCKKKLGLTVSVPYVQYVRPAEHARKQKNIIIIIMGLHTIPQTTYVRSTNSNSTINTKQSPSDNSYGTVRYVRYNGTTIYDVLSYNHFHIVFIYIFSLSLFYPLDVVKWRTPKLC